MIGQLNEWMAEALGAGVLVWLPIVSLVLLVLLFWFVRAAARRGRAAALVSKKSELLAAQLDTAAAARSEAETKARETEINLAKATQKLEDLQRRIDDREKDRVSAVNEFKAIAQEITRQHGAEFEKKSQERLDHTLKPLKEHLTQFRAELQVTNQTTAKERQHLETHIRALTERSEKVSQEAENLAKALKGESKAQGIWGEMLLARVLEDSGLREDHEYRLEAHHRTEDGKALRPDCVVFLPGGKRMVIDSKVSLKAYEEAVNAGDDADYDLAISRHVASVKSHIDRLSAKEYQRLDDGSSDFVIMFLPIEGALSELLRARGDMTAYAAEKNVMIATPTTLMMTLRNIENVWATERRNENAEAIAERAGRLYDKLSGFVDDLRVVGEALEKAQVAHADAVGKFATGRGNALGQIEKLKQLGAKTQKTMSIEAESDDDIPRIGPVSGTS